MGNNTIAAIACASAALVLSTVSGAVADQHAKAVPDGVAKMASCVISEGDDGSKNHAVFYLAGFDSDGTAFYRTISAPIFELTIRPDKSVESAANPCKGDLVFQD